METPGNDLPSCVMCSKATMLELSTWFSSGPLVLQDMTEIESGVRVPLCLDCERNVDVDDYIHVLV